MDNIALKFNQINKLFIVIFGEQMKENRILGEISQLAYVLSIFKLKDSFKTQLFQSI